MAIPENSEANLYPLPLSGKTNLNVELESAETKLRNVHKVLKTIYVLYQKMLKPISALYQKMLKPIFVL